MTEVFFKASNVVTVNTLKITIVNLYSFFFCLVFSVCRFWNFYWHLKVIHVSHCQRFHASYHFEHHIPVILSNTAGMEAEERSSGFSLGLYWLYPSTVKSSFSMLSTNKPAYKYNKTVVRYVYLVWIYISLVPFYCDQ